MWRRTKVPDSNTNGAEGYTVTHTVSNMHFFASLSLYFRVHCNFLLTPTLLVLKSCPARAAHSK